jgi:hypothetical protein
MGRVIEDGPRPAALCRELLAALDAAEGRRRRRKRDTTPDAIGLGIKRALLERAVADDPAPGEFERWLLDRCGEGAATVSMGAVRAMALELLGEWRLAAADPAFRAWLAAGAPSDDATPGPDRAGADASRGLPS